MAEYGDDVIQDNLLNSPTKTDQLLTSEEKTIKMEAEMVIMKLMNMVPDDKQSEATKLFSDFYKSQSIAGDTEMGAAHSSSPAKIPTLPLSVKEKPIHRVTKNTESEHEKVLDRDLVDTLVESFSQSLSGHMTKNNWIL